MSGLDDCPCGHPLNENYRCIAGWYYGPCEHPDCGGVCEYWGDCTSPDCACRDEDEESRP